MIFALTGKCTSFYHTSVSSSSCFQRPGYHSISDSGHTVLQGKVQSMKSRIIFVSFKGNVSVFFASYWSAQNSEQVCMGAGCLCTRIILIDDFLFFVSVYFLNVTYYFTVSML